MSTDILDAARKKQTNRNKTQLPNTHKNVAFMRSQFLEAATRTFKQPTKPRQNQILLATTNTNNGDPRVTPVPKKRVNTSKKTDGEKVRNAKAEQLKQYLQNDPQLIDHMSNRRQQLADQMRKDIAKEGRKTNIVVAKTRNGKPIPAAFAALYKAPETNNTNNTTVEKSEESHSVSTSTKSNVKNAPPPPAEINEADLVNLTLDDEPVSQANEVHMNEDQASETSDTNDTSEENDESDEELSRSDSSSESSEEESDSKNESSNDSKSESSNDSKSESSNDSKKEGLYSD